MKKERLFELAGIELTDDLREKYLTEEVDVESPSHRDVVDWSDVLEAGKETAEAVHGYVDEKLLKGIIANAKKHKPDSTGEAIEIVQGMLRSGN